MVSDKLRLEIIRSLEAAGVEIGEFLKMEASIQAAMEGRKENAPDARKRRRIEERMTDQLTVYYDGLFERIKEALRG